MRRGIKTCSLIFSLALAAWGAASPDVADAVERGDKAAAQKLIDQRADVNLAQNDGATALHWAVFHSDKAMVDLLLKAGANPTKAKSASTVLRLIAPSLNKHKMGWGMRAQC